VTFLCHFYMNHGIIKVLLSSHNFVTKLVKMEVGIIHYYPYDGYLKVFLFAHGARVFHYQRWPGSAHRQPALIRHRRELTYSGAAVKYEYTSIARWCCYYFAMPQNRVYILLMICPLSTADSM